MDPTALCPADRSLLELLTRLDADGYDFVTPTPSTHHRFLALADHRVAPDLRGIMGWSRPFRRQDAPPWLPDLLRAGDALGADGALLRSRLRASRIHGRLYLHSAFPTVADDAVFLGPDSYRFADFIAASLSQADALGRVVDVGAGTGVGALTAALGRPSDHLLLTDLNPAALRLARINAAHAGVEVETLQTNGLEGVGDALDLILANPPYIGGNCPQTYRDGGDMHGAEISIRWTQEALDHLAIGGRMLLYTGSAILNGGRDRLREALEGVAAGAGAHLQYRELDPDVFGEELRSAAYADVERIAVIGAVVTRMQ